MPDNLSSFSGYSSTDEVLLLLKLKKKNVLVNHILNLVMLTMTISLGAIMFQFLSLPT